MNTSSLNMPDDWLALAWCAVTIGLSLLLIYLAGQIRLAGQILRNPGRPAPTARSQRTPALPDAIVALRLRLPASGGWPNVSAAPRFRLHRHARRLTVQRRFDI